MIHDHTINLIGRRKLVIEANLRSLDRNPLPYPSFKDDMKAELLELKNTCLYLGGNWDAIKPGEFQDSSEFAK